MKTMLYPLLFQPLYKKAPWGGSCLAGVMHRVIPADKIPCGESWEICDRCDTQSIVENGPLKGRTIRSLREEYGTDLISAGFKGGRFPLLIKLIDAETHLSVQVHPDETACARIGGDAEPKTEMWHLIYTKPESKIFAGLKEGVTPERFQQMIRSPEIADCMETYQGIPGDSFFIRSGTVHAIGGGTLLLEIQQNSDTTYRVSDWNRPGTDGKPRELHVEKAMQSINFTSRPRIFVKGSELPGAYPVVEDCPFFHCTAVNLTAAFHDTTARTGSFHLVSAAKGNVLVSACGTTVEIPWGRTCLIPACAGDYTVKSAEPASFLQTTL